MFGLLLNTLAFTIMLYWVIYFETRDQILIESEYVLSIMFLGGCCKETFKLLIETCINLLLGKTLYKRRYREK